MTLDRRFLVSIGMFIPSATLENAGGAYYYRYAVALSELFLVHVFSDESPTNVAVVESAQPAPFDSTIVRRAGWSRSPLGRVMQKLARELIPVSLDLGFVAGLRRDAALLSLMKSADVIEFQWVEYFSLARLARRVNPDAPLVGVVHDVVSQRIARDTARRGRVYRTTVGRIRDKAYRLREARLYSNIDTFVVFSEKDATWVRSLHPSAICRIVPPAIPRYTGGTAIIDSNSVGPVVLFEGALSRWENEDAAFYLIREIWPQVLAACPRAVLRLAGAGASKALASRVAREASIELTGRIESMADAYVDVALCVVPLRLGAGLKFKSASAILSGIPLVTTPCGIEGIPFEDNVWCVSDRPEVFAEGVISALASYAEAKAQAVELIPAAERTFGHSAFTSNIIDTYNAILTESRG